MPKNPRGRWPRTLAALTAGLLLLSAPVSALAAQTAGASAPAPLAVQERDPVADYRAVLDQLTALGLDPDQAKKLWSAQGDRVAQLLDQGVSGQALLAQLAQSNAQADRLARYQAYAALHPGLSQEQVVLNVNMNLDRPFYSDPVTVADPASLTVLVNKYNALPAGYSPRLETLGTGYGRGALRPEAAAQFRAMADAARAEGISLASVSAYRSYATQRSLYNGYLGQYARATVDTFSARPGYSEHQTGLAVDINTASTSAHFERTAEYAWLQANCARFGFLLRYPEGKEYITGYRFEPWHYRYVGVEIAAACMAQGLTYEEYLARQAGSSSVTPLALTLDGTALPAGAALRLGENWYIDPRALAEAMGWPLDEREIGTAFTVKGRSYNFLAGHTALCNGLLVRHASPALELEGKLWVPLEDLAAALGWQVSRSDGGIALRST